MEDFEIPTPEEVKQEFLNRIKDPDIQQVAKTAVSFLLDGHKDQLWNATKYFCIELLKDVNFHEAAPVIIKPSLDAASKKQIDGAVSKAAAALDYTMTDAAAACVVVLEASAKIARTSGEYKIVYNDLVAVVVDYLLD